MATYAIGDVQGCYDELQLLLAHIHFDPELDRVWFSGDLVNRGPRSLDSLRFVKSLGNKAICVLGNHDLHLLAVAMGKVAAGDKDTLAEILAAPDREALLTWLRYRPLLHHDEELDFVLVHAGLAPQWNLMKAKQCAQEVQQALRGNGYLDYLAHMYGNQPDYWHDDLTGWDRLRVITNVCTRMRYCDESGHLNLAATGPIGTQPAGFMPWFKVPQRATRNQNIVFGHWAALANNWAEIAEAGIYPLDSGCVWGNRLSALRLEDRKYFSVPCSTLRT